MEDKFVPYPIAFRLKRLGFNEPCIAVYCRYNPSDEISLRMTSQNFFKDGIETCQNSDYAFRDKKVCAPLWQDIVDWLEETHNIIIEILPARDNKYSVSCYMKNMTLEAIYEFFHNAEIVQYTLYNTKLEARNAAVLKAIKIIKKKS